MNETKNEANEILEISLKILNYGSSSKMKLEFSVNGTSEFYYEEFLKVFEILNAKLSQLAQQNS